MKALSDGLKSTLRELVGTRKRFILMLVIQTIGFGLFPVLFLVTLRKVAVELQTVSGDDNDAT